jgi:cobalt-zinc-cadmium efflux system membrane fusion protein
MRFLFILSSIAVCELITGCGDGPQPSTPSPVKVNGATVTIPTNSPQHAALTVETVGTEQPGFLPLTGRLVWDDDATARVFTPFAGIVRKLLVEVNEPVTNGMALAEIQSADFGQAQADARKAESDFRRTERNLNRLRELFEHGAAPRKDLEAAEADFASSQAEQERAEGRLAIYGVLPTSTNRVFLLPSPLGGVLVERNVTPGQEVRPDQMLANVPQFTAPLFTVSDPSKLWVWLDVTEAYLQLVHKGQELTIRSKAFPDQTFRGNLDLISDSLDPTTRTVRARGTVDNRSRLLKAEQYVTVEIPDTTGTSLQVPSKAVFLRDNQYYVFLETSDGQFQRQAVKLGSEREGKVAILDGLRQGQRLVTDGCLLLQSLIDSPPQS